jgi:alkaline phosphatase D
MEVLSKKYAQQFDYPWYQRVRESVDVYGIWDDHDYGINDGGKEFSKKEESRDLLFDFLEVPRSHEAWNRDGAYQDYNIIKSGIRIKLLLLDSRYFRDKPSKEFGKYIKKEGLDVLGETQWEWLESQLLEEGFDFFLIGNGIQIIPEEHKYEKWANFPTARERLFTLIEKKSTAKVIFLSGDRHISEVSAIQLKGLDYPLYDITSSGLTHPYTNFPGETNKHRIGDVVNKKNYSLLEFYKNEFDQIKVDCIIAGNNQNIYQTLELF